MDVGKPAYAPRQSGRPVVRLLSAATLAGYLAAKIHMPAKTRRPIKIKKPTTPVTVKTLLAPLMVPPREDRMDRSIPAKRL
jgi:hypothetical protein